MWYFHVIIKYIFIICLTIYSLLIDFHCYWDEINTSVNFTKAYDYIIVGAGTAGNILALRLTRNRNNSVLLVEAGPQTAFYFNIPAALALLQGSKLDWQYETVSQRNAANALHKNKSKWPRGRLFGGSGMLNNMIYLRGDRSIYEKWFNKQSDFDYGWDILQYFHKAERNSAIFIDDKQQYQTELGDALLSAAKSLNYTISDLNFGMENTGFMRPHLQIKSGARFTTGHYLKKHKPSNLDILTNTEAKLVNFRHNFEADSLIVQRGTNEFTIKAHKGIVLAAGTINTPKLLIESGVGLSNDLNELNIKSIANLPVGYNLQDHVTTGLDLITLKKRLDLNTYSILSPLSGLDYFLNGNGPWSSNQAEIIALFSTGNNTVADLQLMALNAGLTMDKGAFLYKLFGVKSSIVAKYFANLYNQTTISLIPVCLLPESRGYVKLNNKRQIEINPKYLQSKRDVDVLIKGIEIIKLLVKTPAMQELGAELNSQLFPGCETHQFDTRNYWECYVRALTLTTYHPVGTASMDSVVDFDFRVKGLNRLFVADASVLPAIPNANINAAVAMMAEKAAASIIKIEHLANGQCDLIDLFLKCN